MIYEDQNGVPTVQLGDKERLRRPERTPRSHHALLTCGGEVGGEIHGLGAMTLSEHFDHDDAGQAEERREELMRIWAWLKRLEEMKARVEVGE